MGGTAQIAWFSEMGSRESNAIYQALVEQATDAVLICQDGVFQYVNRAAEALYGYTVEEMTGMPFLRTLSHHYQQMIIHRHEARLAGKEVPACYEGRVLCKDGSQKDVEISVKLMDYGGQPATLASVRDITYRKTYEQSILQHSRQVEGLYKVLMAIAGSLDLCKVLHEIVRLVGEHLSSDYTCIYQVTKEGALQMGAEKWVEPCPLRDEVRPLEIALMVMAKEAPVLVSETDFSQSCHSFHAAADLRSYAGMSIRTADDVLGVLLVHNRNVGTFSGKEGLLRAFATQAAIGIRNARLYRAVQDERARVQQLLDRLLTSQEDERKRISLDLHDTTTQSMYAVMSHLAVAQELMSRSNFREELRVELVHAKQASEQTLLDLRRVTSGLHPPSLGKHGLTRALRQHLEQFNRQNESITCSYEVHGSPRRLSSGCEVALYRVFQELLNNVAKHAEATRITTHLTFDAEDITLEVRDNGKGFLPPKDLSRLVDKGHLGLAGITERVDLLGGTVALDTRRNSGTSVKVIVPL